MSLHRIRLPEPWQVERVSGDSDGGRDERLVYRRRFQRPSGLNDDSRITVEIELLEPLPCSVEINGRAYGAVPTSETTCMVALRPAELEATNQVCIAFDFPDVLASPRPAARLGHDYLRSVTLHIE